ncbi:MAG: hypothetical protein KAT34_16230, partial [Candidatus Aminicenantes bacterium]|nr:hypothetical protein [Candidatus Aminicenantes bacterium]
TKVWVSDDTGFKFPEKVRQSTGVCFPGGGTRALTAAMGQLRGLTQLKLIKNVGYISCVSGGSWASTAYTFYKTGAKDDSEFLGPITDPQDITMDGLGIISESCLGHTATTSLRHVLIKLMLKVPEDELWLRAISEVYFEPFGIYSPDRQAYFSLDENTVKDIKKCNPVLKDAIFNTVRQNVLPENTRPYLVINSTLIGPNELAPFSDETVVTFQYTPLYVGSPLYKGVTYKSRRKVERTLPVGGGFIEPFAFGGTEPVKPPAKGTLTVPKPAKPFALANASGASSAAYAGFIEELLAPKIIERIIKLIKRIIHIPKKVKLKNLAPQEMYWPVTTSEVKPAKLFDYGDGAVIDNLGLISLLQRQVKTIIVFLNTGTKLDLDFNPDNPPKKGAIDSAMSALFGYPFSSTYKNNQVFKSSDFSTVVGNLQDAKRNGVTIMTTSELEVQQNDWWGVEGNWTVKICWVYNDRVAAWESQLEKDIRKEINKGNRRHFKRGKFRHFPNYKTVDENFLDLVELTPEQVNLLAHLCCWNVLENRDTFKDLLSPA